MADLLEDQSKLLNSEVALAIIDWLATEVPVLVGRRITEAKPAILDELRLTAAQRMGIKQVDIVDDRLRVTTADGQEHILDRVVGKHGRSVEDAHIDDNGNLIITLEGMEPFILGQVVGRDGRGINTAELSDDGTLSFLFEDGEEIRLGNVKGRDGSTIRSIDLVDNGNLKIVVANSDGGSVDYVLGPVVGQDGKDGADGKDGQPGRPGRTGAKGEPGRGIVQVKVDKLNGHLLVDYDDGVQSDVGYVGAGNVLGARITRAGVLKIRLEGREKELSAGVVIPPRNEVASPGFIWRGEYQRGVEYTGSPDGLSDVVGYQGSSYICMGETSVTPPSSPWELMARAGQDGHMAVFPISGGGGGSGPLPDGLVYVDGSTPFTAPQGGVAATDPSHLVTKAQLDAVSLSSVAAYSILGRASTPGLPVALPTSADMLALFAAANYAAARDLLDLVIGTDVQAYNALLQKISGGTAAANSLLGFDASNNTYMQSILALGQSLLASNDPIYWRQRINRGITTLTDAATIATDCSTGNVFSVTLGGNRTLGNPTNVQAGATYIWFITQGSGGQTLALGSNFKLGKDNTGADITFTASTGAGLTDTLTAVARTTTNLVTTFQKGAAA